MRIRNAIRALAALGLAVLVAGCSETVYQKGGAFDRAPVETKLYVVAELAGFCVPKAAQYYLLGGALTEEGDVAIRKAAVGATELAELTLAARAEYLIAKERAGLLPADGSAAALAGTAAIGVESFGVVLDTARSRLQGFLDRLGEIQPDRDPAAGRPSALDVIGAAAGGVGSLAVYGLCRADVFARLERDMDAGRPPGAAQAALLMGTIGGMRQTIVDGARPPPPQPRPDRP